jgi:hypothetical protein
MKRRKLGLLAGSSLMSAAALRNAKAQTAATADPTLLTTTLTPLGAERAGNADGSIPAWTGGLAQTPEGSPVAVRMFEDEPKLLTIDSSNMDQHADRLSEGVKLMMTKYGYSINVYPTHRTASALQYVYDNAAKNVTRAQFSPSGGRFGFTGAYGAPPFPIIDKDPDIAGPQLIWNHLTAWTGYCNTTFSPGYVITGGDLVLSEGGKTYFMRPYYDPAGSPETFDGYLVKTSLVFQAPANFNGQEALTWHTANTQIHPDITWTLLNGQGRVRKAPDEAYDSPNGYFNGSSNYDESSAFYGDPHQYDWKFIEKKEMYIPYNNNNVLFATAEEFLLPKFPNPDLTRWEKHRVWVVEATLHPGIRNVLAKRRFYIDEDSWNIAVGEAYDGGGNMASIYLQFLRAVPAIPCVNPTGFVNYHPQADNYLYAGLLNVPGLSFPETITPIPASQFDPQLMAANASF